MSTFYYLMQLDFSVRKSSSSSPATKPSYFYAHSYEEVAVETKLFNSYYKLEGTYSDLFKRLLWWVEIP